jgi:hypothetical protein
MRRGDVDGDRECGVRSVCDHDTGSMYAADSAASDIKPWMLVSLPCTGCGRLVDDVVADCEARW